MGNSHFQSIGRHESTLETSQCSIWNFFGSSSGRFLANEVSSRVVHSEERPSSIIPRRRSTTALLTNSKTLKTQWPLSRAEAIFLPEFPVKTNDKHWNAEEIIAKGAFGKVYKVNKEEKIYALKVLSKTQVVGENAVRQVKEEARIQQLCGHHTFIVDAISRWQTKKHLHILLEYVAGGELSTLLQLCRPLPEQLVKIYVAELAIVLDFLHNAGVIYRDLKPENILLDSEGHLKLTDFGLSKWLSRASRTFTICGTARYIANE